MCRQSWIGDEVEFGWMAGCYLQVVELELDPPGDELLDDDELLPPQAEIPAANSPVTAIAARLRLTLIGLPPVV